MQPFGLQNLSASVPSANFTTGVPWGYIRLRNESSNELVVSLSGSGGGSLGAWMQDDFFCGRSFTGQVGVAVNPSAGAASAGYVVCDAYSPGELTNPGPTALPRQVGVTGGTITVSNTFSSETLSIGSQVIDIGEPGHTSLIVINNDGSATWKFWDNIHNRLITAFTIPSSVSSVLNPLAVIFNGGIQVQGVLQADGGIGPALADVTLNGSTSGQVQLFQSLRGNDKRVLIIISNLWNSTLQTMAIPIPFTGGVAVRAHGNMSPIRALSSGVAQGFNVVSAISATTGAETTVQTTTPPVGVGWRASISHAVDTIEMSATGNTGSAFLILEGT